MNIPRKPEFSQVCVWPGTLVGADQVEVFEKFIAENFNNTRVQYLEEVKTFPDLLENGLYDIDSGGRNDVFFAVHSEDVGKFAVPRMSYGIRWIEDVLDNEARRGPNRIYPDRVTWYRTW
jgi:hypothetical protein